MWNMSFRWHHMSLYKKYDNDDLFFSVHTSHNRVGDDKGAVNKSRTGY